MKAINSFLSEREESKAHKQAVAMGLKYRGFGLWADPQTGKTAYKTEGDQLVPVESSEEADKATPGSGDATDETPGRSFAGIRKAMSVDADIKKGEVLPGEEQAEEDSGWNPGPDGDNYTTDPIGDREPTDTFVGGSNNHRWNAGPDGTNFTNVREETDNSPTDSYEKRMRNVARIGKGQQPSGRPGSATQDLGQALNRKKQRGTADDAKIDSLVGKMIGSDARPEKVFKPEDPKRAGQRQKDQERVTQMNKAAQPLFSDPNFNLDDVGEELGSGAFGSVFLSPDGKNVIKEGEIGPDELEALSKMKDNPAFPTLINGRFDTPFYDKSSVMNNPGGQTELRRGRNQSRYFDPDDFNGMDNWDERYPTAKGRFAMSKVNGEEVMQMWDYLDDDAKEKALTNFWRARAQMHKAGISHNDMHPGNVFVDEDGNVGIVDLGLAQNNKMAALMEAIAGVNGEDFQLAEQFEASGTGIADIFDENKEKINDYLVDELGWDVDDASDFIFGNGGIRMKTRELDDFRDSWDFDDDTIDNILKRLYDGIDLSELQQRMSNAYDKRASDTDIIKRANALRAMRGEGPIDIGGKIVPPKNLLPDD